MHGSTLQNYVNPIPKSPSTDASQETEALKINLDRSTENPRPSYARACMATPRKKHMDISISADEFELFEAPSDIDASPRIKASTESLIPAESKRNPRPASYVKGRYIVLKAPKKVRDEARKALTAALDQVPSTIHFDRRGKRTSIHQTSARFIPRSSMSSHDRYTSVSWTARTILHHQMIVFLQNTTTIWIR